MKFTYNNKIEKINSYLDFSNGNVYTLLLIARKKNNEGITNSQEITFQELVTSPEDLENKINKLTKVREGFNEEMKLYISCNPRNIIKAYMEMKKLFLDWDCELWGNTEELQNRLRKVPKLFFSCLAKCPAQKKYFMLDIDCESQLDDVIKIMIEFKIFWDGVFITKNGYHILFACGDCRELMEKIKNKYLNVELKRDSLLCIAW